MPSAELAREFVGYASQKLGQHLAQVERCVGLLEPGEVWHRVNAHTNSVGNLVLHLAGNVRQWILGGVGGAPQHRDRPAEFAARGPQPGTDALADLSAVVRRALEIIAGLDAAGLAGRRRIQGYDVSVLTAVFHVVEHFAGHAAQIVHMTKALRDVDLSLYDAQGRRLDERPHGP